MTRRLPSWARRALTLAALAVYTLAAAELFIRLVHPQPRMPRYITGTAWGVRGNIPGARYAHHTAEVAVDFRINGQGMRDDRDVPRAKPAGTCRVALFGDSFFVGYELDLADTIAARLEGALKAAGYRAQVLNFAVSGFGTAESLVTYESYGRGFDPDVVIFEWDRSDYDDNVRSGLFRLDDGRVARAAATFLPAVAAQDALMRWRLYRWLADTSDLYNMLREHLGLHARNLTARTAVLAGRARGWLGGVGAAPETPPAPPPASAGPAGSWQSYISPEAVRLSGALLRHAERVVAADGRGFHVLDMPYRLSRTRSVSSLDLVPAGERRDISVLSPTGAFNAAARPDRLLFYERGDGHITPDAVGIVVSVAMETLRRDPHLAACR